MFRSPILKTYSGHSLSCYDVNMYVTKHLTQKISSGFSPSRYLQTSKFIKNQNLTIYSGFVPFVLTKKFMYWTLKKALYSGLSLSFLSLRHNYFMYRSSILTIYSGSSLFGYYIKIYVHKLLKQAKWSGLSRFLSISPVMSTKFM